MKQNDTIEAIGFKQLDISWLKGYSEGIGVCIEKIEFFRDRMKTSATKDAFTLLVMPLTEEYSKILEQITNMEHEIQRDVVQVATGQSSDRKLLLDNDHIS